MSPLGPSPRLVPGVLALGLTALATPAAAVWPGYDTPPPEMPATDTPLALYQALGEKNQRFVDERGRVVTFEATESRPGDERSFRAVSLGTLRLPPKTVRGLLAEVGGYPQWLRLHPSYKNVRVLGPSRIECETGRSTSPRTKAVLRYRVGVSGATVEWTLEPRKTPLEEGSRLAWQVVPHPEIEGATLVVHRQLAVLPAGGRLTRYLSSDDSEGRNRFWKDANKHARRIHWAIDAALRHPPGAERQGLYLEHYQREFGRELPYWAR